jgi:hypothetical protein
MSMKIKFKKSLHGPVTIMSRDEIAQMVAAGEISVPAKSQPLTVSEIRRTYPKGTAPKLERFGV